MFWVMVTVQEPVPLQPPHSNPQSSILIVDVALSVTGMLAG